MTWGFSLIGGPLVVLLVAGCQAVGAVEPPEALARTPAEWLEIVERQNAELRRSWTPEREQLMRGAALYIGPYTGKPGGRRGLSDRELTDVTAFDRFMNERGEEWFAAWLEGEELPVEAEPYRYALYGVAFSRYHKDLRRRSKDDPAPTPLEQRIIQLNSKVEALGQAALRKGYRGQKLTPEDIEALRLYAIWVDVKCCGGRVLPFHLGQSRATRIPGGRWGFKAGEKAPDFTLMRMEAGLERPDYTDRNPMDRTDVLMPNILREFLLTTQGYEAAEGGVVPKPTVVPPGREDDYVTLSSFCGKKPVLLVLANPSDAFCWHWKIAPMFEPIRQAYGDRLEMLFINTTIHDTYMPMRGFFSGRDERAVHDLAMWQRARGCKMFYMNWPHFTTDYLLDDMAQHVRNAYMDQGGGAYIVLVDLDGNIAYTDYHQNIPGGLSFYDEVVYVRMNNLESRLKSFFDNGARYAPKIETPLPDWRRSPLMKGARVRSVDRDAGMLTVRTEGGEDRVFEAEPGTRVTVACGPAALADIESGRKVTISYREVTGEDGTRRDVARWIRDPRDVGWDVFNNSVIWLSGRIERVEGGRMTVQVIVPPAERMKGLDFWEGAGDRAKPYKTAVRHRLETVRRWVKEGPSCRRTFALDGAVDIFLHGHAVEASDLRPGDMVGVRYYSFQDADELIYPFQVRATRRVQAD